MKLYELSNLWIARNKTEDFNILVVANCENEALDIAKDYAKDAKLTMDWTVTPVDDENAKTTRFDCDYAITNEKE